MSGLSKAQRSAIGRVCLALGGGAGGIGTLIMTHNLGVSSAVVGTAAIAALPGIIRELNVKKVARIKAETEAEVARQAAQRRTTLVNAGLNGNLNAVGLLTWQVLDDQVLAGHPLSEDMLRELLLVPRASYKEDPGQAAIRPGQISTTKARP